MKLKAETPNHIVRLDTPATTKQSKETVYFVNEELKDMLGLPMTASRE